MTGRIAPEVALADALGQRCKRQLGARQRILLGGHVAIPKFVGQNQIRFGPHRHHRLIASPFIIMVIGRLLVTLNDRRVLIHGRNPLRLSLLFIQLGNPPHQATLYFLQGAHRLARRKDEALLHFPLRPQLLQVLVVEPFQELPHCRRFGRAITQAPGQTLIPSQKMHVLGAFTAHHLEQRHRLDQLSLQEAALTLAQTEIGGDQIGQTQRTVSAGNAQQAGMRASRFLQRLLVQDKGRLVQQGQASSHGATYRLSI